jgi:alkanesulfonate monooxygenase SsuD/methylene tetrahydromethanopterin reductase-like flavin-dependent oxidoreductase (luciferase family)
MSDGTSFAFGLHTFGELSRAEVGLLSAADSVRNVVSEGVAAENAGLDFFGVGEHHRPDFAVSQPDLVLAAVASRTSSIQLGTAVTVLSVHEPVYVVERFATLDALSSGRAEVTVGPGAFPDIFQLLQCPFDERAAEYEKRLSELLRLVHADEHKQLVPAVADRRLPVRVASSGNEASMSRAARLALPVTLAIREGDPLRFSSAARRYFREFREGDGRWPELTLHATGYVGSTLAEAREASWPYVQDVYATLGAERGWGPLSYEQFLSETEADGSMLIGPAEVVATKIARWMEVLGASRFALKYAIGSMPHALLRANISRFGEEVVPRVSRALIST